MKTKISLDDFIVNDSQILFGVKVYLHKIRSQNNTCTCHIKATICGLFNFFMHAKEYLIVNIAAFIASVYTWYESKCKLTLGLPGWDNAWFSHQDFCRDSKSNRAISFGPRIFSNAEG